MKLHDTSATKRFMVQALRYKFLEQQGCRAHMPPASVHTLTSVSVVAGFGHSNSIQQALLLP